MILKPYNNARIPILYGWLINQHFDKSQAVYAHHDEMNLSGPLSGSVPKLLLLQDVLTEDILDLTHSRMVELTGEQKLR